MKLLIHLDEKLSRKLPIITGSRVRKLQEKLDTSLKLQQRAELRMLIAL